MYSWASSRIPLTLYDIQGTVADTLHRQPAKSQNNWKHDLFFLHNSTTTTWIFFHWSHVHLLSGNCKQQTSKSWKVKKEWMIEQILILPSYFLFVPLFFFQMCVYSLMDWGQYFVYVAFIIVIFIKTVDHFLSPWQQPICKVKIGVKKKKWKIK